LQFNELMTSINEHRIRQRVASIYDMAHGAQADGKAIKEYVGTLLKQVGLHTEAMGTARDFNSQIGSI
jgi:hypothetical protein